MIVSAKLILHEFGNAGEVEPPAPQPSYIQVMRVSQSWDANTLSWNNAPLVSENYTGTWVNPITGSFAYIPYEWDISRAVADAYQENNPLRLVLYESDSAQNSGKYFVSNNDGDWNAVGRPTIQVTWGDPAP